MVSVASTLPVGSTIAIFEPVRRPGSRPSVARGPAGAAINKSFKLVANTSIASISARSFIAPISSVSMCIDTLMRHAQLITCLRHVSAGALLSVTP